MVIFGSFLSVPTHAQQVTGFADCGYQGATKGNTGQIVVKCLRSIVTFVFVLAIFISAIQIAAAALGAFNPMDGSTDVQKDFQRKIMNLITGIILMGTPILILNLFNPATTNFSTILDLTAVNKRIAQYQARSNPSKTGGSGTADDSGNTDGGGESGAEGGKSGAEGGGGNAGNGGNTNGGTAAGGGKNSGSTAGNSGNSKNTGTAAGNGNNNSSASSLNSSAKTLWTEKILTDLFKETPPENLTKEKLQTAIDKNIGKNSNLKTNDLLSYIEKTVACLIKDSNCAEGLSPSQAEKKLENLGIDTQNDKAVLASITKNISDLGNIVNGGEGNDDLDSYSGDSDDLNSNSSSGPKKVVPKLGEITGMWPKAFTLVTNQDFVKTGLDDSGCQVLHFQAQELDERTTTVLATAPIETYSIKVCNDKNSQNANNLGPKSPNDWLNFKDFIKRNPDGTFEVFALNNVKSNSFNISKGVLFKHDVKLDTNSSNSLQKLVSSSSSVSAVQPNNQQQTQPIQPNTGQNNSVFVPNGPVVMFGGTTR